MHGDRFVDFLQWEHGAGLFLLFAAVWCVSGYLVAFTSGWHKLAQRYRCEREFEGEQWRFRSGAMRCSTRYNNVLTLGANREGLYLAVLVLFRPGHPPLFIPWSEITVSERRRFCMPGTQFMLGPETQIPLWVFQKMGDSLLEYRPADGELQGMYSRPGLDDPRTMI